MATSVIETLELDELYLRRTNLLTQLKIVNNEIEKRTVIHKDINTPKKIIIKQVPVSSKLTSNITNNKSNITDIDIKDTIDNNTNITDTNIIDNSTNNKTNIDTKPKIITIRIKKK